MSGKLRTPRVPAEIMMPYLVTDMKRFPLGLYVLNPSKMLVITTFSLLDFLPYYRGCWTMDGEVS